MSIAFPMWFHVIFYVIVYVPVFVAFIVLLIFLLNWAWEKFFNYLGGNEIPDQEHDETRT